MKRSVSLSLLGAGLFTVVLAACSGDETNGTGASASSSNAGSTGVTSSTGAGGSEGSVGSSGSGSTGGSGGSGGSSAEWNLDALLEDLEEASRHDYKAGGDGGLTHSTYWTLGQNSPEFMSLPAGEQDKVKKVQSTAIPLASQLIKPGPEVPGTEIVGTLVRGANGERRQRVVLKLPTAWNGRLIVAGAPGTRNEFANEVILASWLVAQGYAFVSGDKGMPKDSASLFEGKHATQYWGDMIVDLGLWARDRLKAATGESVTFAYAAGLSNGGYQVRRGLEIDHQRVLGGEARLFAGGLNWSGPYWPDARALDTDKDGAVTPAEFAAANHIIASNDRAALAMGWAYDPATLTTPAAYAEKPPYSAGQAGMTAAGFSAESAVLWGAYNTLFDALKASLPQWKGVGYFNLTAFIYRADLLGHTDAESVAYSCYALQPDQAPPYYAWVKSAADLGFTQESVNWALKNANTGEFSAPLISVHGDKDALVGLLAHGHGYRDAVMTYGDPKLHRLFVIANGPHVDRHADGALDYDFDGQVGEEGAADQLTPMQGYAQRAFDYLTGWVEEGKAPPESKTVATDPVNDVIDPAQITF